MLSVGLSSGALVLSGESFFSDCAASGITDLEIGVYPDIIVYYDYGMLKNLAERYGIRLWSFHLPFYPFATTDIATPDEAVRRDTVAMFRRIIADARAIGVRNFVVHPSTEPIPAEERAAHLACAQKSLAELAEFAAGCDAVIAVEDLPRTCLGNCAAEMETLLAADPRLRVCFDTNHLLGEDPAYFAEKLGSRIVTLHVSDYDFIDERHWLPGEGKIDWKKLTAALDKAGYRGPWLYEVGLQTPPEMLSQRGRDLTCADFVRNAREVLEHRDITVISASGEEK